MIRLLPRYIAKNVIWATLLVMGIVAGLAYFIGLLNELRDIGVGEYGVLQAAIHAFLELPHGVYEFFPMLVLLGGLMGLGALASHQELVVMRVSGLSIRKIMLAVFNAAIVLILLGMLIGEIIAPRAHYLADIQKSVAQSGGQAVVTASGLWVHEGNNFIHIDRVMAHNHLEGVTRYEFDDQHSLLTSYYAKNLDYIHGQWHLDQLVKTTFSNNHTQSVQMNQTNWDLKFSPNVLNIGLIEPEELPLTSLWNYTHHMVSNGLQAKDFEFSFWKRVLEPLTILVMLFLAVPFVFTAPRSVTLGWQLILGIVVGFIFYVIDGILGQLCIVFQLSPFIAAAIPIILFAGVGYTLMMRIRN